MQVAWYRTLPLTWARPEARSVLGLLAAVYSTHEQATQVAREAGVDTSRIDVSGGAAQVWTRLLDAARSADRLETLFSNVLRDAAVAAIHVELRASIQDPPAVSTGAARSRCARPDWLVGFDAGELAELRSRLALNLRVIRAPTLGLPAVAIPAIKLIEIADLERKLLEVETILGQEGTPS